MEIDHQIADALAWQAENPGPELRTTPIAELRRAYDAAATLLDPQAPEMRERLELVVPGAAGELAARLFVPESEVEDSGLLIWFHGGGWIQGSLASHDAAFRRIAEFSGHRVLGVDYRLAPEFRFPSGLDDAEAVIRWAAKGEEVPLGRGMAVGGDSAGASLALVATLETTRLGHGPLFQALCYPALGPDLKTESFHELREGFGLTADQMDFLWSEYLDSNQSHADPRVSPLLTPDLGECPPTIVSVAGFDPLRDEGLALVGLLEGAGVSVDLLDESSLIHGFIRMAGVADAAHAAIKRLGDSIARAFEEAI